MKKLTTQNLHTQLSEALESKEFVLILNAIIEFLRSGGRRQHHSVLI